MNIPSVEELQRLFDLDFVTGALIRRHRADVPNRINKRFAGQVAGYTNKLGYVQIGIGRKLYLAHRIIWKMATGDEPLEIDHVNNNPTDNRLVNLRIADRSQNTANRRRKDGKALPKGVQQTPCGNFVSEIRMRHSRVRLGTFHTAEEAHAAYCEAAERLHGEFARTE